MNNIEKGSKVKLKSISSPEMLVDIVGKRQGLELNKSKIYCVWFVENENKGEWFDITNLEVID